MQEWAPNLQGVRSVVQKPAPQEPSRDSFVDVLERVIDGVHVQIVDYEGERSQRRPRPQPSPKSSSPTSAKQASDRKPR